jgi:DNA-binding response OmpR family regulator
MISPANILEARILIVDDLEANVSLLEQMLGGAGYVSISSTTDPHKVSDLHLKNRYDLILLDLQMPDMDGFQVIEALKKIETHDYLPVLVITAIPGLKLSALKAGAKDFVSKPFEFGEVLLRIHNMLEVRLLHLESKRLSDKLAAEAPLQKEKASERGPFEDALKRVQAQLSVQLAELEAMLARGKSDTPAMSKKSAVSADSVEKRREAYRVLFL